MHFIDNSSISSKINSRISLKFVKNAHNSKNTPTIHAFHENKRKIPTYHNCLLQNLSPVSTPRKSLMLLTGAKLYGRKIKPEKH
jgi:hypothetical protein